MPIFQNNSPSQAWKEEGRKNPVVQPSFGRSQSSAFRSLGQLLGEVFVKRINLGAQQWAEWQSCPNSLLPVEGEIESPMTTNIWSLWQREEFAHRGGEKERSEKWEFWRVSLQGEKWTVCVETYREISTLDIYPPWIFTQTAQNRPTRSSWAVKKKLIYRLIWKQLSSVLPAAGISQKRIELRNAQVPLRGCSSCPYLKNPS